MNSFAVKKFIDFLKDEMNEISVKLNINFIDKNSYEEIISELDKDESYKSLVYEYGFIDRLISILESMESDQHYDEVITDDFCDLSDQLVASPLKKNEKFDILMLLIKRNIDHRLTMIDQNILILDGSMLTKSGISLEKIDKLVKEKRLNLIMDEDNEEKLSEEEKDIKEKLISVASDTDLSSGEEYVKNHKILEQLYFNNIDGYDYEDIKSILIALKNINVNSELCSDVEYVLKRKLNKRKIKEKKEAPIHFSSGNKKSREYVSDKEYKQIKKILKQHINLYTMEPLHELSEDEIMYCANLLLKIGTSEGLIKTFFFRSKNDLDLKNNPIGIYNRIYKKIKFYEEKLFLEEDIATINDFLGEMFIATDEDYLFWKEQVFSQLTNVVKKFPQSYEYEIEKAKTYGIRKV